MHHRTTNRTSGYNPAPNVTRAKDLPADDKSNVKVTGFDIEFTFIGGATKNTKDVSDLSAAIYQTVNAALTLDMAIEKITLDPIYGEKA